MIPHKYTDSVSRQQYSNAQISVYIKINTKNVDTWNERKIFQRRQTK